jgi:hypothetical protein
MVNAFKLHLGSWKMLHRHRKTHLGLLAENVPFCGTTTSRRTAGAARLAAGKLLKRE